MEKIEHNATTIAAGKDEQFTVASIFEQLLNNFGRTKKDAERVIERRYIMMMKPLESIIPVFSFLPFL